MLKGMRYKTKVDLAYWAIMGPLIVAGAALIVSKLAHNPRHELRSLVITVVFSLIGGFIADRIAPLRSTRGMTPEEEDTECAGRVSGTAMGLQMIAACLAIATSYVTVSHLQSGAGWDHDAGDVCIFCILLFLVLYPVRRNANRHIPTFRPGQDTLTFVTLASFFAQIAAAPTAVIALLLLVGQLGNGEGWNGGLATVFVIATLIYYAMRQWRRWARNHFPIPEPTGSGPSEGRSAPPPLDTLA